MAKIIKKRLDKRNPPPGKLQTGGPVIGLVKYTRTGIVIWSPQSSQSGGSDTSDGDAIKVFIRIRPPDSYDVDIGQHRSIVVDSSGKTLIVQSKPEKVFTFDKIIKEDATQDGIFSLVGKEIIDSCISGYNGTIFAYGQTGSGKTYTMLGPSEDAENFQHELRGIVPRSFEYLFHVAKREQELVYKENLFDLLKPSTVGLQLRKSTKKGIHAVGLTEVTVTSPSEAYQVLSRGWRNRRVASTSMNRESSRSHAVFSVIIESKENKQGLQNVKTSRLNLVDLAGSERQKDTNAVGKRLKEASSINTSLSTLGNVIKCLVDKAQFIPYRNSKLTFLLRDSLGGNAKTHLISCVHPSSSLTFNNNGQGKDWCAQCQDNVTEWDALFCVCGIAVRLHLESRPKFALLQAVCVAIAQEKIVDGFWNTTWFIGDTKSTLQFAERAKMIKNTATVNLDTQGDIPTLQAEIRCLKEQLRQFPSGITASSVIQQSASGETQVAVSSEADKQVLQDRVDSLVQQIQDLESRSQSLQLTIDRLSMALQETEEEESSQKDKVEFLEKAETVSSQKIAELEARNHFLQQRKDLKEDLEADVHFVETLKEKVGELQSENDELNIKISELEENKEILRTNWMKVAGNDANRIQSLEEKVKVMETCNKELRTRLREHQDRSPMPESSVGTSIAIELTESENMNSSLSEESDDPLQTMQKRYRMLEQELHSVEESKNAKIESLQERIAYLKENEIKLSETLVEMENEEREIRSRLNIYERQGTGGTKSQSLQLTIDRLSMALQETEEEESSQKDKIHSEIDELHHHLQARRGSYGNSLSATKMTSQAFKQFEMTVELIEKKIENFSSTAELMVQDDHYDSVHIGREIDMLKTKWTTFHTSVNDYRKMLDISIQYFTLIEETESWMREANTLLISIGRRAPECRTPEEAEQLVRSLQVFMEEGKPKQEERLQYISELAVQLYGDEGPARIHHLFVQNQDLMQSFQQAETEVSKLQHNLRQEQMVPEPAQEEIVPMEVAVTASIPKNPPKILQHLKDAEVMEGEKVTLECHVESYLPLDVTWYKDNLPLNSPDYETKFDRGVATLTIEETFSEDTARYTCRLVNEMGAVESSSYLNVRETYQQIVPPEFIKNLKSMDVLESGPFAFECQVTGIPSPTISWYKDDQNVDSSPEYVLTKINGTCCLKIRKINRQHSARYTCRANNPGGEAASSARLTVIPLEKPLIHRFSEDVNIPEGKSVKLEVHFSGSPTPEVTWYRNQDRITPTTVYKITIEVNKSTLEITEAYAEDSGTYKIVLQNTAGEVQRSCQVNVESFYSSTADEMSQASTEAEPMKPTVVQALAPTREVMEGSRVRLDCVIVGHPEPEVIWYRKDKPVKESKDMQLLFEGDRCTLSIREAYLEDSGIYRCVAKNMHGETESVCKLHVEPLGELSDASVGEMSPPKFTQLMRDLSIPCGHRVCLQCRVTGHPVPEVQWFKDNKPIDSSPDYQITAFADVHNLTIPETFEEDSGNYMVKASNLAGEAKCYAKLTVKVPPEPIQEAEVMRLGKVVETKETKMIIGREDLEQAPPEFQKLFQDTTVNAGEAATFECTITGSPKPKVTWYFNGEPVVSRDYQITMEGNKYKLHIPETFDEDAGRFSITAENPSGKATCSALLNVDEEQTIQKTRIFGNSEISRVSRTETMTSIETHVSRVVETMDQEPTYVPSYEMHSTALRTDAGQPDEMDYVPSIESREHYATTLKTDVPPKFQPVDLTIEVPIPPKFLQPLKNITSMEGTKVTFDGVVSGKPEPTIKWFREGKELSDQADFEIAYRNGRVSLTIPEVFEEDAGRFSCQANNPAGQATSSAELFIKASMTPPTFIQKLPSSNVAEGKPIRFTVRVAGKPPPTVTWLREGTQIVSSPDFEIIQEGDIHSLYIPEVFQEDAGKFTVLAENPAGKSQCTAELRIEVPMEETEAPVERPVTEIKERFEPKRAPPRHAPPPVPTEEPETKVAKLQRPSQFVKQIEPVKPREPSPRMFKEQFQVEVEGKPELPLFEQRFTLPQEAPPAAPVIQPVTFKPVERKVPPPVKEKPAPAKQKPVFTKGLKDITRKEGEGILFECIIESHPEPIVKWYREDIIISSSPDYEITWENNVAKLAIAEIFPEDAGVFRCTATNTDGSTSSEARLSVQPCSPVSVQEQPRAVEEPMYQAFAPKREVPVSAQPVKPEIVDKPVNCRLVEGTNAVFESRVTGTPFPEVAWMKRGFPIRKDNRHRITVDEKTGRCSLLISHTKPDDAGEYTCTAVNVAGDASATAALIPVEAKAPSPPPMPSIPVAPLKSWRPVPVAEPAHKVAAPAQEPMVRKPWQPVAEPAQKVAAPVKEPMMRKPWEPTQEKKPDQAPWQQWTPPSVEQIQKREAPTARTEPKFVIPHSEKILESNLQYRQMKEPDLQRPPPAAEVEFLEKAETVSSQKIAELEARNHFLQQRKDLKEDLEADVHFVETLKEKVGELQSENDELNIKISELEENKEILRTNWMKVAGNDANRIQSLEEKVKVMETCNKELRTRLREHQDRSPMPESSVGTSIAIELTESENMNSSLSEESDDPLQTMQKRYRMLEQELHSVEESKNAKIESLQERIAYLKENEIKLSETLVEMENEEREIRSRLNIYERQGTGGTKSQSLQLTIDRLSMALQETEEEESSQKDKVEFLEKAETVSSQKIAELEARNHFLQQRKDLKEDLEADVHFVETLKEKVGELQSENDELNIKISELEENKEILRTNWMKVAGNDANRIQSLEEKVKVMETCNKELRTRLREHQDRSPMPESSVGTSIAIELTESENMNSSLSEESDDPLQTMQKHYRMLEQELHSVEESKNAKIESLQERIAYLKENEIKLSETLVEMENEEREIRSRLNIYKRQGTGGTKSQSLQLTIDRLSMALQETEEEESSQKDKVEFLEKAETVSSQKIAELEARNHFLQQRKDLKEDLEADVHFVETLKEKVGELQSENDELNIKISELEENKEILRTNWMKVAGNDANRIQSLEEKVKVMETCNKELRTRLREHQDRSPMPESSVGTSIAIELTESENMNSSLSEESDDPLQTMQKRYRMLEQELHSVEESKNAKIESLQERIAYLKENEIKLSETLVEMENEEREIRSRLNIYERQGTGGTKSQSLQLTIDRLSMALQETEEEESSQKDKVQFLEKAETVTSQKIAELEARNHFLQQRKDLKEDLEADVHFVETLKEKVGELQSENDELNFKISELEENKEILRTNWMKVAGNDANRIQSLEEKVKVMETCNKELRTRLREHQDRSPMPESSVGTSIAIELTESENMNSSLSEESDDPLQTMQKRYRMLEQELHSVEESKNAKIESLQERIAYLKENEIKLSETLVEMENEEREIRSRLNIYERQGTGGTKSQSLQLTIDRLSMALQETEEEESSQKDKVEFLEKAETVTSQKIAELEARNHFLQQRKDLKEDLEADVHFVETLKEKVGELQSENDELNIKISELEENKEILRTNWMKVAGNDANRIQSLEEKVKVMETCNKELRTRLREHQDRSPMPESSVGTSIAIELTESENMNSSLSEESDDPLQTMQKRYRMLEQELHSVEESKNAKIESLQERIAYLKENEIKLSETLVEMENEEREIRSRLNIYERQGTGGTKSQSLQLTIDRLSMALQETEEEESSQKDKVEFLEKAETVSSQKIAELEARNHFLQQRKDLKEDLEADVHFVETLKEKVEFLEKAETVTSQKIAELEARNHFLQQRKDLKEDLEADVHFVETLKEKVGELQSENDELNIKISELEENKEILRTNWMKVAGNDANRIQSLEEKVKVMETCNKELRTRLREHQDRSPMPESSVGTSIAIELTESENMNSSLSEESDDPLQTMQKRYRMLEQELHSVEESKNAKIESLQERIAYLKENEIKLSETLVEMENEEREIRSRLNIYERQGTGGTKSQSLQLTIDRLSMALQETEEEESSQKDKVEFLEKAETVSSQKIAELEARNHFLQQRKDLKEDLEADVHFVETLKEKVGELQSENDELNIKISELEENKEILRTNWMKVAGNDANRIQSLEEKVKVMETCNKELRTRLREHQDRSPMPESSVGTSIAIELTESENMNSSLSEESDDPLQTMQKRYRMLEQELHSVEESKNAKIESLQERIAYLKENEIKLSETLVEMENEEREIRSRLNIYERQGTGGTKSQSLQLTIDRLSMALQETEEEESSQKDKVEFLEKAETVSSQKIAELEARNHFLQQRKDLKEDLEADVHFVETLKEKVGELQSENDELNIKISELEENKEILRTNWMKVAGNDANRIQSLEEKVKVMETCNKELRTRLREHQDRSPMPESSVGTSIAIELTESENMNSSLSEESDDPLQTMQKRYRMLEQELHSVEESKNAKIESLQERIAYLKENEIKLSETLVEMENEEREIRSRLNIYERQGTGGTKSQSLQLTIDRLSMALQETEEEESSQKDKVEFLEKAETVSSQKIAELEARNHFLQQRKDLKEDLEADVHFVETLKEKVGELQSENDELNIKISELEENKEILRTNWMKVAGNDANRIQSLEEKVKVMETCNKELRTRLREHQDRSPMPESSVGTSIAIELTESENMNSSLSEESDDPLQTMQKRYRMLEQELHSVEESKNAKIESLQERIAYLKENEIKLSETLVEMENEEREIRSRLNIYERQGTGGTKSQSLQLTIDRLSMALQETEEEESSQKDKVQFLEKAETVSSQKIAELEARNHFLQQRKDLKEDLEADVHFVETLKEKVGELQSENDELNIKISELEENKEILRTNWMKVAGNDANRIQSLEEKVKVMETCNKELRTRLREHQDRSPMPESSVGTSIAIELTESENMNSSLSEESDDPLQTMQKRYRMLEQELHSVEESKNAKIESLQERIAYLKENEIKLSETLVEMENEEQEIRSRLNIYERQGTGGTKSQSLQLTIDRLSMALQETEGEESSQKDKVQFLEKAETVSSCLL